MKENPNNLNSLGHAPVVAAHDFVRPSELWPDRNWCYVPGFNERYAVSDKGDVYNCTTGCLILFKSDKKGGSIARLVRDGVAHEPPVQLVVATAFVPNNNPVTHTYVGHRNNQRNDNRAENLMWISKNQLTQQLLEQTARGHRMSQRRTHLEAEDVLLMRAMNEAGVGRRELAIQFNTSLHNVRAILNRDTWWHLPEGMRPEELHRSIFTDDAQPTAFYNPNPEA